MFAGFRTLGDIYVVVDGVFAKIIYVFENSSVTDVLTESKEMHRSDKNTLIQYSPRTYL